METGATKEDIENELKKDSVLVEKFDTEKGGIYIEITDDPRGWYLGDKTRRIYKATIGQVVEFTNLLVTVHRHWDGIKVRVHNSREVSRMLTSLNDDVGSSVKYVGYDGSDPLELCADIGQHVCIQSMTNGNWIRVQIFPGEEILPYISEYD